jgi:hypothetical protein
MKDGLAILLKLCASLAVGIVIAFITLPLSLIAYTFGFATPSPVGEALALIFIFGFPILGFAAGFQLAWRWHDGTISNH